MRKIIRIADGFVALLSAVVFSFVIYGSAVLPEEITAYENDSGRWNALFSYSENERAQSVDFQTVGTQQKTLKLLGVVPVKTVSVTSSETKTVFVSGEAFGIKLYTNGVMVVGTQSVDLGDKKVNPAEEAGIQVGDILLSINNMNVFTSDEVTQILNDNNGKPYTIRLKRDGRYKTFRLTPVFSDREGCYKAGMWVRDSMAGIGTITFYNQEEGTFAALGHQINDVDTNTMMPLLDGEAVSATVTKVQKASAGTTGSLVCDFGEDTIGRLTDNTEWGLYGAYTSLGSDAKEYPLASKQEVKKGYAQILSTVDSGTPRYFDIEITHISYNKSEEQKDIVFRVTDSELLKTTGGIVQGMSGSPIVQGGKLVGAVTHVIVNHPEKGYAVFAQTMYEMSNTVG